MSSDTALLVVDVQNGMFAEDDPVYQGNEFALSFEGQGIDIVLDGYGKLLQIFNQPLWYSHSSDLSRHIVTFLHELSDSVFSRLLSLTVDIGNVFLGLVLFTITGLIIGIFNEQHCQAFAFFFKPLFSAV